MELTPTKDNDEGRVYELDNFKIYYKYAGSISGDNNINPKEIIYLIIWAAEFTIGEDIFIFEAPAKVEIPAKTYHKIIALSDISFLVH